MRALWMAAMVIVLGFVGCSESGNDGNDDGTADGGETTDGGSDGVDSGTPDGGDGSPSGVAPPAGKATVQATFSNASGTFNGNTVALTGDPSKGTAKVNGSDFSVTATNAGQTKSISFVITGTPSPAAGTTYPLNGLTAGGSTKGEFQYLEGNALSGIRTWRCVVPLLLTSVSGKTYNFSASGTCSANTSAGTSAPLGTVDISATGAATLN